jgi:hypothetical protein
MICLMKSAEAFSRVCNECAHRFFCLACGVSISGYL